MTDREILDALERLDLQRGEWPIKEWGRWTVRDPLSFTSQNAETLRAALCLTIAAHARFAGSSPGTVTSGHTKSV